jgi:hypothetical protein
LVETFRQLGILVGVYGLNCDHAVLPEMADYLFCYQTADGDIHGILDNQIMHHYHGMILSYLIEAGYAGDPRVQCGLDWLLRTHQADGGWVIGAQPPIGQSSSSHFGGRIC